MSLVRHLQKEARVGSGKSLHGGTRYHVPRKNQPRDNDTLDRVGVAVDRSLVAVKGEAKIAAVELLYACKPGHKGIGNRNRFHQRHVHSVDPPAGYMSLQETIKDVKDSAANHINSERNGAFAYLTGSIAAFRKNLPQIRNQLASRINREYYSSDDTALFLNVNHRHNSDVSVDGFDFSIGREGVRLDDGFRDGSRIVSLCHDYLGRES